jgi:hypothetical protein
MLTQTTATVTATTTATVTVTTTATVTVTTATTVVVAATAASMALPPSRPAAVRRPPLLLVESAQSRSHRSGFRYSAVPTPPVSVLVPV